MDWFRFYTGVLEDPKVQRLDPWLFKQWVNLLCLAGKSEPRGMLPCRVDIAFALRISEDDAMRALSELEAAKLLDLVDGALVPHGWTRRQKASDDVTARVRKHRSGPIQGETFHETDKKRFGNGLEQNRVDTDTEENRTPSVVSPSGEDDAAGAATDAETPKVRSVPKPKETPIPDDFAVTDQMAAFAANLGLSPPVVAFETEKFIDHFGSKKSERKSDWIAAWRNWMRRVGEFQPAPPRPKATNGSRPSTPPSGVVSKGQGDRQRQIIGRD